MSTPEEATPADIVIRKSGGPKKVARYVGRSASLVSRWKRPKARGGTDGIIPAVHQLQIIEAAITHRFPLRLEDFFPSDLVERLRASNAELGATEEAA